MLKLTLNAVGLLLTLASPASAQRHYGPDHPPPAWCLKVNGERCENDADYLFENWRSQVKLCVRIVDEQVGGISHLNANAPEDNKVELQGGSPRERSLFNKCMTESH